MKVHERAQRVPRPTFGYTLVKAERIEKQGSIIVPDVTPNPEGPPSQGWWRFKVIESHPRYIRANMVIETELQPGDTVLIRAAGDVNNHPFEMPSDYRLVATADIVARHPCEMGEPMGRA